jgi:ABC-type multidrug transport system ATPase subunit
VALAAPGRARRVAAPPAIALLDLTRVFTSAGKPAAAVDNLSLTVHQGEVFGLLGPNGSGKTTLINMICGLIPPTSGSIEILGLDARRSRRQIRALMGVVPQETALYGELTAQANMEFHATLYGVPRREHKDRIARRLEGVDLAARKDSRVSTFSGGMARRLAIARALLHDPQLLILDEPTLGVDPQAKAAIWEYIAALRGAGRTVLVTTNVLDEAQHCDRIAIIDHGRVVRRPVTPAQLRHEHGGATVEQAFLRLTGTGLRD